MSNAIRNRIKGHRRVGAADLVPHELNFRTHPELQQAALRATYAEVGFARSLLAFELPDGWLKLIDGHLRRDVDPDMEVDVEVLDVSEEEARALLLSMGPLAALAETQGQIHARLMELTSTASDELRAAWQSARAQADVLAQEKGRWPGVKVVPEQYLVLVTCRDERHQVELLGRFQGEGLDCKCLLS